MYTDNNAKLISEYPKYSNGDRIRIWDIDFGHGDSSCGYSIGDEGVIKDESIGMSHELGVYFVRFDDQDEEISVCVEDMEKV